MQYHYFYIVGAKIKSPPASPNTAILHIAATAVILGVLLHIYCTSSGINDHYCTFHLPSSEKTLIGRVEEKKIIMDYLDNEEVSVVTLWGQAGFGKSIIAWHIGQAMANNGSNVCYIRVEDCTVIECLISMLEKVSNVSYTILKKRWAEGTTRTLLILDNVDGSWGEDESLRQFLSSFLYDLVENSNSSLLKILITSQRKITMRDIIKKLRTHRLRSLAPDNCIELVNLSVTQGPQIAANDSEAMCNLVGYVPEAVTVLCGLLSHDPNVVNIHDVIKSLKETYKLKYMAKRVQAETVDKERLLSAISLAFDFIEPEFQICGLLLAGFPGTFSKKLASQVVTPDMMKRKNPEYDDFSMEPCLIALSARSFLENISFETLLEHQMKEKFHFHVLIGEFLNNTRSKYDIEDMFEIFWKNYVDWLSSIHGEVWLRRDVGKEDYDAIVRVLNQGTNFSHSLAASLSSRRFFVTSMVGKLHLFSKDQNDGMKHYHDLLHIVAKILLSDCEVQGSYIPYTSVATAIKAYTLTFDEIVCVGSALDDDILLDCMKKLILCQPKIEQLHFMGRGNFEAMEASSYFHQLVELKCMETEYLHSVCDSAWKYRLLGLAHVLVTVRNQCLEYCQDCRRHVNTSLVFGLESYSLLEDYEAIKHLHMALNDHSQSSCKELQDSIIYSTLYAIYSRQGNQLGMDESVAGILSIDFQRTNMTCYSSMYGDVVIPFLQQVKETETVKKLKKKKDLETSTNCKDIFCDVQFRCRPLVIESLIKIAPLWVQNILSSSTSLFCSVSKVTMAGCESPFPLTATDLSSIVQKSLEGIFSIIFQNVGSVDTLDLNVDMKDNASVKLKNTRNDPSKLETTPDTLTDELSAQLKVVQDMLSDLKDFSFSKEDIPKMRKKLITTRRKLMDTKGGHT